MACYLIHFSTPLAHSQHYLGYTKDVDRRLAEHRAGRGTNYTAAAVTSGISLILARVWPDGTRDDERRLKGTKHYVKRHCPICNGARAWSGNIRAAHEYRLSIESPELLS